MTEPPRSTQAEEAVLGRIMADGDRVAGEVVGSLRPEDFYEPAHVALYEKLVEHYYADQPLDPITIGQGCIGTLRRLWGEQDASEAIARVRRMTMTIAAGGIQDHASVVRSEANKRRLLDVAHQIERAVADGGDPEQVASITSEKAMRIATDTLANREIHDFETLGRRYISQAQIEREAVKRGVELGARFGLRCFDFYTRGLRPTELMFCCGEPGVGKTAVVYRAALNFAEQQARRPQDEKRIGTLVLSLEMGESPSSARIAQTLSGVSGTLLRDATFGDEDMKKIVREWGRRRNLPLYFNFTSTLRESQLRALVVEAVRRYNVGLIVIDHFKHLHTDREFRSPLDADEEKAHFLKTAIAEDLNVAVVCLAHTTKGIGGNPDRRPQLTDLRGSYQIAAIADFVCFIHRPIMHATQDEINSSQVTEQDAEVLWRKNRQNALGEAGFYFEGDTMQIRDNPYGPR